MAGSHEPYHIYIVEDDPIELATLKTAFETEGYTVTAFDDGLPVPRHVSEFGLPHIAVIDLRLKSTHGFNLSQELRAVGDVPIIFISTENDIETVVEGISKWADDYVVKPFDPVELVARVRRVLSRIPDFSYAQSPIIQIDDRLAIDFGNTRLLVGERRIPLTPTETSLLHILLRNRGRVVSSETLISRVWPLETVFEETLRVHMHRLRRKIEPDHRAPHYIQTERGQGYRFAE